MGLIDDTQFHFFHFFPYTALPGNHKDYESLWVDFSNANYDPQTGHDLYHRYLSEMVLADKLGYDGLILNEHHNSQYCMNPAPNLTAAALIPQTTSRSPSRFQSTSAISGHTQSASRGPTDSGPPR